MISVNCFTFAYEGYTLRSMVTVFPQSIPPPHPTLNKCCDIFCVQRTWSNTTAKRSRFCKIRSNRFKLQSSHFQQAIISQFPRVRTLWAKQSVHQGAAFLRDESNTKSKNTHNKNVLFCFISSQTVFLEIIRIFFE